MAEFERDVIRERTKAGLDAARVRGRLGGRKRKLTPEKAKLAKKLYEDKTHSIKSITDLLGISRPTLYKYLKE